MPELPEVETIKRGLAQKIHGLKITNVELLFYKSFIPHRHPELVSGSKAGDIGEVPSKIRSEIEESIIGSKIKHVSRRGKALIFVLSNGFALLIHLKMTGQLVLVDSDGERFAGGHPTDSMAHKLPDSSTRLAFRFSNGSKLFFNDQRKFGWVRLVKTEDINPSMRSAYSANRIELLETMGPEPLGEEFNPEALKDRIQNRSISIKAAILDQKTVAGVGNIYADEALNSAKIHPEKPANKLSNKEIARLVGAVKKILQKSIDLGGTSFTNYVNAFGKKGNYLEQARVFRREGKPCPNCGGEVKKIRVAGRGTHYCPKCQKYTK